MIYFKKSKAFTLIELLLVISIIALLTSLVLVLLSGARAQGRDAKRKAETDSLRKSLALYYADYGTYPTTTSWVKIEDTNNAEVSILRSKLQPYLPTPPSDPLYGNMKSASVPYSYQYMSTTTASGEIAYKIYVALETGIYASYETYSDGGGGITYGGGGSGSVDITPPSGFALAFDGSADYVEISNGTEGSVTGGYALQFDGNDDNVKVLDSPSLNIANAITLEAWIKPAIVGAAADYRTVVAKNDVLADDGGYGIILDLDQSGVAFFFTKETGATWVIPNVGEFYPINRDEWHHIVATYDKNANIMALYVDGYPVGSDSIDGSTIGLTVKPLYIGGDPEDSSVATAEFEGSIDGVRVYSRALDSSEALEHFSNIYNNETGLAGLWNFGEGSPSCATADSSGNNNNGALEPGCPANAPLWIDNTSNLNITDKITIETWIKPKIVVPALNWRTVIGKQSNTLKGGYEIFADEDQDTVYFHIQAHWRAPGWEYSRAVYVNYTFPEMDKWYHIIGTYDRDAGAMKLFVNGVLVDNVPKSSDPAAIGKTIGFTDKHLYIGGDPINDSAAPLEFEGTIDETRIYHRILTDAEAAEHYNGTFNNETGLVGLWHFNEGGGSNTADSSGNNSAGVLFDNPQWIIIP